ncbi:MAG: DUF2845 domain-containing protein [Rhodanobacter sp.]|nr:DUF2845 domain-containing protein [Rhodanobacter sp.]
MRRYFLILALCSLAAAVQATSTLRVGTQVLTAGDSALRVTELLGKPTRKSHHSRSRRSSNRRSSRHSRGADAAAGGERWLYRRGDHVTTVTIVDDQVVDIDDRRE